MATYRSVGDRFVLCHTEFEKGCFRLCVIYNSEMSTSAETIIPRTSTSARIVNAADRRQRWFEVALVLLVACGNYTLYGIYLLINGPSAAAQTSGLTWIGAIVQEVAALLLLGYVLSRRGLTFANLGLGWSLRNVGLGVVVFGASYAAYVIGYTLVQTIHYLLYGAFATGPTAKDFFAHHSVGAIPLSLLNPFFEELIVRAYVMTEVIELTGSSTFAIALSVAVQFSYHLYYGWIGAISMSFLFLVLALYYLRSRSALPIIVAHAIFDVYGLLRIW